MCCTRRILGLALLVLLVNIGGRAGAYTNQWAAHIEGGPEVARQVAQDHGFRFLAKVRSKANAAAEKCKGLTKTFEDSPSQHNRGMKDDQAPLCSRRTRSNHQAGRNVLIPQCVSQFLREKSVTSQMINRSLRSKVLRRIVNVSLIQSAQHFTTMASKSQLSAVPKKLLAPGAVDHKMVVRCAGQLRKCVGTREKSASQQKDSSLDKFGAKRNFSRSLCLEESCPIYDRKPAGFVNRYDQPKSACKSECSKECRSRESIREEEVEEEESYMKLMHSGGDKKCREIEEAAVLRNTISDPGGNDKGAEKCKGETHESLTRNSLARPLNLQRPCNRPVVKKKSSYVIPRPCPTPKIEIYDQSKPDPPPPRAAHWTERQAANRNSGGRKKRFQTVKSSPMYYAPNRSGNKNTKSAQKSYFSLTGSKQKTGGGSTFSTCSEGKQGAEYADTKERLVEKRTWSKEGMMKLLKRECAASKFLTQPGAKNKTRTQENARTPEPRSESARSESTHAGEGYFKMEKPKLQRVNVKCAESAAEHIKPQKANKSCAESASHCEKSQKVNSSCAESAAERTKCQQVSDRCAESATEHKKPQKANVSCAESAAQYMKSKKVNSCRAESVAEHMKCQKVSDSCTESAAEHTKPQKANISCAESAAQYMKSQKINDSCTESTTEHIKSQKVSHSCAESAAQYMKSKKVNSCRAESAAEHMKCQKVSDSCTESAAEHTKSQKANISCAESAAQYMKSQKINDSCTESATEHIKSQKVSHSCAESSTMHMKPQKMNLSCTESSAEHTKFQKTDNSCSKSSAQQASSAESPNATTLTSSCNQGSHSVGEQMKCTDSPKLQKTPRLHMRSNAHFNKAQKEDVTCAEPVEQNMECADSINSKRPPPSPKREQESDNSCAKPVEKNMQCSNSQKSKKSESGQQNKEPTSQYQMVEKVNVTCPEQTEQAPKAISPPKKPKPPPSCINDPQNSKCKKENETRATVQKCTNQQPPKKIDKSGQVASFPEKCPEGITFPKPPEVDTDPSPVHILSQQGKLATPKAGTIFKLSDICDCKPNTATLKYRLAKCPNMKELWDVPELKRSTHRLPPKKKRNDDVLRSRSKIKMKEPSGEWSKQRYMVRLRIFKGQDGLSAAAPRMTEVKFGRSVDQSVDAQLQNMKKFEQHNKFVPQGTPPHRQQSQCAPKKCVYYKERDRMKRLKDSCVGQRNHEYYERLMKKHANNRKG